MPSDAAPAAAIGRPAAARDAAPPVYLGIDVSKAELVAAVRDGERALRIDTYANSKAGIAKMLRHWCSRPSGLAAGRRVNTAWRTAYWERGAAGLANRSRAPKRRRAQLAAGVGR